MSVFAAMTRPAAHNEPPERPVDAHPVNSAPTSHVQVTKTPGIQVPACDLVHSARHGRGGAALIRATEGSIMPAIFDFLYREFCRARLTEMRRQLFLIQTSSPEVAEAKCSVSPSDRADDRTVGDEHHEAGDRRPS